jgi:hypothetical protein
VAGTIEYLFRRSAGGSGRDGEERFCVEADVARNQIVVCGTQDELAQVRELTAKLGAGVGAAARQPLVRVVDTRGQSPEELLERIRRLWPQEGANPLEIVPPAASPAPAETPQEAKERPADEPRPKSVGLQPAAKTQPAVGLPPALAPGERFLLVAHPLRAALSAAAAQVLAPRPENADPQAAPAAQPPASGDGGPAPSGATPPAASPVRVSPGPDGRLIVTSPDAEALDRFGQLLEGLLPKEEGYRVFQLEHASAFLVRMNLEDVFDAEGDAWSYRRRDERDSSPRLSARQPLRFISDSDTNTVLVQHASAEQLEQIERLVETYDRPERVDPQTARGTAIVPLDHAQAADVADMVKEVYRDLLSDNDKALGQNQQQEQRRSSFVGSLRSKRPQFKGTLSLGTDERSNQVIVSAPQFLLPEVVEMIRELDASAASHKVAVVALRGGVDSLYMQETLSRFLGQPQAGGAGQASGPPSRQRSSTARSRRFERGGRMAGGN